MACTRNRTLYGKLCLKHLFMTFEQEDVQLQVTAIVNIKHLNRGKIGDSPVMRDSSAME